MVTSTRFTRSPRRRAQPFALAGVEHYTAAPGESLIWVHGFLGDAPDAPGPALVVTAEETAVRLRPADLPDAEDLSGPARRGSRWGAGYTVPAELAHRSDVAFALALGGGRLVPLPVPAEAVDPATAQRRRRLGDRGRWAILAAITALAIAIWAALAGPRSPEVVSAPAPAGDSTILAVGGIANPDAWRPAVPAAWVKAATPAALPVHPPDTTVVARAVSGRVPVYASATAASAVRVLGNPGPHRIPLVLMVQGAAGDRLHVLLPVRPNGSSGWVSRSRFRLLVDPYRVRVDLTARWLSVYRRGRWLTAVPIGVGRAVTPTPAGLYYITELLRQANPRGAYGPFAFGLSGHSNVLHEFASGDGRIGIHGTNNPAGIGRRVSHGCIRVRNRTIVRLARMLPLGTPVQIARPRAVHRARHAVPRRRQRKAAASVTFSAFARPMS